MARRLGDQGIVLYLVGDPAAITYVSKQGASTAAGTLGAAYVAGATFNAGRSNLSAALKLRFNTAATITVKVEKRREDEQNASVFDWSAVLTVRGDTGDTAFEHAFVVADGATQHVYLDTSSSQQSGDLRISAKANAGGLSATDWCIVGVDA